MKRVAPYGAPSHNPHDKRASHLAYAQAGDHIRGR
jgi:hypothetical protein